MNFFFLWDSGGMEGAFPGANASPASLIRKTISLVDGKGPQEVLKNRTALAEKVFEDVFVEERSPGEFSNYRRCLVVVFVERFLNEIVQGIRIIIVPQLS